MGNALTVLVLGGGPDREREVSLKSAASVAAALRKGGHRVIESDILPDNLSALDQKFDVVFPVLHGSWGEGGPLQELLDRRGIKYVGCRTTAAQIGMDKLASKQQAQRVGVLTAAYQIIENGTSLTLEPPLVLKPIAEGSSVGVEVCRTAAQVEVARQKLHPQYPRLLAEQFIKGCEVTVGIVDQQVLPPIMIVPVAEFYDFQAKYDRNDTRYEFDTGLPETVVEQLKKSALAVYNAIGCRHLSRVDFIVDDQRQAWFLEINTLPGFTDHSLLPKAAAKIGLDMPRLCDKLVRLAVNG